MNAEKNKMIVMNFIEDVWNNGRFDQMDRYIAGGFVDHSLPATLPAGKEGTKQWILGTGRSFAHKTIIDDLVCEGDTVVVRLHMQLTHTGTWRNIEPTQFQVSTVGYRLYKLADEKIVAHWGLIDGTSIETQLKKRLSLQKANA